MSRLEMLRQNNRKELDTNIYDRKEYVVSHFLVVWLYITFFFVAIAGAAAALFIEENPKQAQTADWVFMMATALMIYILVVAVYILISLIIFSVRYGRSRQSVRQYTGLVRQLGAIYEQEDENVRNGNRQGPGLKKLKTKTSKKDSNGKGGRK